MMKCRFRVLYMLVIVVVAVGLAGCLDGPVGSKDTDAGKKEEVVAKAQLNELTDDFIAASETKELTATLEFFASDMKFVAYFGESFSEYISMFEEELSEALETPEREEFVSKLEDMPFLEEMGTSLYDLYHSKGPGDNEVKDMMTAFTQRVFKVEILASLLVLVEDDPDIGDEFVEEFLGWVDASELLNDGLSMPRGAFERFFASLLSLEGLDIGRGEGGPVKESGKWYVTLSIGNSDNESDEEHVTLLLGFKEVEAGWVIDLFHLDVSLLLTES